MLPEQQYLSQCPSCGAQIDVTSLEPFAKINCPECRQSVRVRRKFDHYVIIKQIGEGGMSRVFEAEDESLGRRVALKILNRTYSRDAARIAQFQQEALVTARVTHPNVIKLFSGGWDQGRFFIAMELVAGGSLEARIKRDGIVPEKDALRIGRQVAEGLRAAMRVGLIHRDIKPANILFTEDGTAKVVDFGLAMFGGQKDESGEIWATPYYVAPEKLIENEEDFRSDLFSLGATLYHAMTGKPPHKANTNNIQELRMIKCKRVSLDETGMPFAPRTVHVVDQLLAFKPEERPASYDEAVDELRLAEGLTGRTIMSRLSWRRKAAIFVVGCLLLAYGMAWLITALTTQPAPNITTNATTVVPEKLGGEGGSSKAGQASIFQRMSDAREAMFARKFKEAAEKFEAVIKSAPRQPTLNWARYNAALCDLIIGERQHAQRLLRDLGKDPGPEGEPSTAFFRTLSASTTADLGMKAKPSTLSYATDTEEVMGWLIQGIAHWHYGQPQTGREYLQKFLSSRPASQELEWIEPYRTFLQPYANDLKHVSLLQKADLKATDAELEAQLKERQQALAALKVKESVLAGELESGVKTLSKELGTRQLNRHQLDVKEQLRIRKDELEQLADVTATLPHLARGYDFSPAINHLSSLKFVSPEVVRAIEGQLYLHREAAEFMQQLCSDIATRGWQGRVARLQGTPLDGRVTGLTLTTATITLSRGVVTTVPLTDIAPAVLVDIAQGLWRDIPDSTDYYRCQELIAAFARVKGQDTTASTIASQLMEENRAFRTRWLRLPQSGI